MKSKPKFGRQLTVAEPTDCEFRYEVNPDPPVRRVNPGDVFFRSAVEKEYEREGLLPCLLYGIPIWVPLDKIEPLSVN